MTTEKNTQSVDFLLDERLQSLDNTELCDLVENLLDRKPEIYQLILEWFKEKQKTSLKTDANDDLASLDDNLLFEYWEDARCIISEFNEYGGGPEDAEYEAYGYLDDISKLIEEGNITADAKFDFLEEAFKEYNHQNSGFEDGLMDIFFEICQTKEEWEYLVKKLDEHPSNWRKKLIMRIQRKYLHDDEAYLKERMKNLQYGMDYWDLVEYYDEKEDLPKALETAEEGILNGEGKLTELFEFLSEHFTKKGDTANLERIVHTALSRQSEEKNMLDRLFEHYKLTGDYGRAKETLLESFGFTRHYNSRYYEDYKRIKGFLKDQDWKSIEPEIFNKIKEKDLNDYLRICLDKNMKETVIETILNKDSPRGRLGLLNDDGFDVFADKLEYDFPEKVIEYYWQKAYRKIPGGNRKTYQAAAKNLTKAKNIYIDILKDEAGWINRFSYLKSEFKNRPAFLDEVKLL
jgi:uncharacterized Zn finger protein